MSHYDYKDYYCGLPRKGFDVSDQETPTGVLVKENTELKKRAAKLEADLEELYNKVTKLYWAVDKLSDLDWHI